MKIKENKDKYYYNVLLKINHKPLIIENIFTYIIKSPNKFFNLIEEDKLLSNKINSFFHIKKKSNNLTDVLKNNINFILTYKKYKNSFNFNIINNSSFLEEKNFEIYSDPSIITFLSKDLLEQINKENERLKKDFTPSVYGLGELIIDIFQKLQSIQLIYLPKINIKTNIVYNDGYYIEKNLKYNCFNQEIDILYCIIDDNEFYNQIKPINNNIKIKKIYLEYIKGNKNINIFYAIKKYLNNINNDNIEEIIFGEGFFKTEKHFFYEIYYKNNYYYKNPMLEFLNEEVFINKRTLKVSCLNKLKININSYKGFNLNIYLGISLLFVNADIEGVLTIDSKTYNNKDYKNIQHYEIILIKIHDLLFLKNISSIKTINQYLKNNNSFIILYISEFSENKKEKEKYTFNYPCSLFYSEKPLKNLDINEFKTTIKDDNNGLIMGINYISKKNIPNLMFLLRKFNTIIFDGFIAFTIDSNKIIINIYKNTCKEHFICFINLIKFINKNYTPINYIYSLNCNILEYFHDDDKNIKKIFVIYNYNYDEENKYKFRNKTKFLFTECDLKNTQNVLNFIKNNFSIKKAKKVNRKKNPKSNSFYENYLEEEDEEYYSEDDDLEYI